MSMFRPLIWIFLCGFTAVILGCGGGGSSSEPDSSNPSVIDTDGDGVADINDRFVSDPGEQSDRDNDGIGDNGDADDDNDGVSDAVDKFPHDTSESGDFDNDGIGDVKDLDDDNDAVADSSDSYPNDPTQYNRFPIAVTSNNVVVAENTAVQLDASDSHDTDGQIVAYQWRQLSGPEVHLAHADSVIATFTAPGVLSETHAIFAVSVTDDRGFTSSQNITVVISPVNDAPVAAAGPDRMAPPRGVVLLDGSESRDPEGLVSSMNWRQISGPTVTILSPSTAQTQFFAPDVSDSTQLSFELSVVDDQGLTAVDTVVISIEPLVVDAGDDIFADRNETIMVIGGILPANLVGLAQISWSQISGSPVVLNNSASLQVSLTTPAQPAVIELEMTATVAGLGAMTDRVKIIVDPDQYDASNYQNNQASASSLTGTWMATGRYDYYRTTDSTLAGAYEFGHLDRRMIVNIIDLGGGQIEYYSCLGINNIERGVAQITNNAVEFDFSGVPVYASITNNTEIEGYRTSSSTWIISNSVEKLVKISDSLTLPQQSGVSLGYMTGHLENYFTSLAAVQRPVHCFYQTSTRVDEIYDNRPTPFERLLVRAVSIDGSSVSTQTNRISVVIPYGATGGLDLNTNVEPIIRVIGTPSIWVENEIVNSLLVTQDDILHFNGELSLEDSMDYDARANMSVDISFGELLH